MSDSSVPCTSMRVNLWADEQQDYRMHLAQHRHWMRQLITVRWYIPLLLYGWYKCGGA